jgi:hypothetical protein
MSIYSLPNQPKNDGDTKPESKHSAPADQNSGDTIKPTDKLDNPQSAGSIYGAESEVASKPSAPPKELPIPIPKPKEKKNKLTDDDKEKKPKPKKKGPPASVYEAGAQPPQKSSTPDSKHGQPQKKRRGCGCTLGCLTILLLPVVLGGSAAGIVAWKWSDWTHDAIVNAVLDTELPDSEKEEVIQQLNRLHDGYEEGEISADQLLAVAKNLATSPLFAMMVAGAVQERYVNQSGLDQEEKELGRIHLHRVARGFHDSRIEREELDPILDYISDVDAQGDRTFHATASDEDVRLLLDACRDLADAASLPGVAPQVNVGNEFRRVVDNALQQTDEV